MLASLRHSLPGALRKASRLNLRTFVGLQCKRNFSTSETPDDANPDPRLLLYWYRANKEEETNRPQLTIPDFLPKKRYKGVYSTPVLTREEAEIYLRPLFFRGWDVQRMDLDDGFNEPVLQSCALVGKMALNSYRQVQKVVRSLITNDSYHPAHVAFSASSGRRPIVTVISQDPKTLTDITANYRTRRPGITLNGVRMAALLEEAVFENDYLYCPQVTFKRSDIDHFEYEKKLEWEELMSRYPWQ